MGGFIVTVGGKRDPYLEGRFDGLAEYASVIHDAVAALGGIHSDNVPETVRAIALRWERTPDGMMPVTPPPSITLTHTP